MAPRPRASDDPIVVGETGAITDESGYVALPTSGEGPGLLVLAPRRVPASEVRGWCDRLAREGYVAFAPGALSSPFGGAEPPDSAYAIDPDRALAGWMRAVDRLVRHPGVTGEGLGVLGVGDGAGPAMLLAELKPSRVRAVVVFYGADRDVHFEATRAAFQGHFASDDPSLPDDAVRALEAQVVSGGREAIFHRYPATRPGFFEASSPSHDVDAEASAWARTLEFLRDRLSPG